MFTKLQVLLFLLVCSISVEAQRRPQWVRQRPSDSAYYLGIGMSSKEGRSGIDYARDARNQALEELSSEIQVTVSANSILHQFEDNFEFRQQFESQINTSIHQTLEGYEVETWESRSEYWVMVRLSRLEYERRRQQRLDRAKMMASAYFSDARSAVDRGDVSQAISSYARAVLALEQHIGEDLTHRTPEGPVNFSTDIMSDLRDLYRRIRIEPVENRLHIEFSRQMQQPLVARVDYLTPGGSMPAANLPIAFEFTSGDGILNGQSRTDFNGEVQNSISRLISRRKIQEVRAYLDVASILTAEELENPLLTYFLPTQELPSTHFTIEMSKADAYCVIQESVFGEPDAFHRLGHLIRSDLNENFFNFTSQRENAEYVVTLTVNFTQGDERKGTGYSVFLVYADLHLSIKSLQTGTQIFSDGFLRVRGMRPGSFEHALSDARDNVLRRFREEILPKLDEIDI